MFYSIANEYSISHSLSYLWFLCHQSVWSFTRLLAPSRRPAYSTKVVAVRFCIFCHAHHAIHVSFQPVPYAYNVYALSLCLFCFFLLLRCTEFKTCTRFATACVIVCVHNQHLDARLLTRSQHTLVLQFFRLLSYTFFYRWKKI